MMQLCSYIGAYAELIFLLGRPPSWCEARVFASVAMLAFGGSLEGFLELLGLLADALYCDQSQRKCQKKGVC